MEMEMSKEHNSGAFGIRHALFIVIAVALTAWAMWGMGAFDSKKPTKPTSAAVEAKLEIPALKMPCPQDTILNGSAGCPATK